MKKKIFQKENYWPFPKLYGSCGRVIIESFEGETFANYLSYSFIDRVIAVFHNSQILFFIIDNLNKDYSVKLIFTRD
jgi:hypothetical protein